MLGLAAELGKDYKDAAQMKEVVDWVDGEHRPERPQVHDRPAEMQQLFESGAVDAVAFWNSLARLEYFGGNTDAALLAARRDLPRQRLPVDPQGRRSTRCWPRSSSTGGCSPEVQFPNAWPIDHGQWSELSEGFLGPDYVDQVPDWFQPTTPTTTRPSSRSSGVQADRLGGLQRELEEWQDYYAREARPVDPR